MSANIDHCREKSHTGINSQCSSSSGILCQANQKVDSMATSVRIPPQLEFRKRCHMEDVSNMVEILAYLYVKQ